MFASCRIAQYRAGTGEVSRVYDELGEIDRKLRRERLLHFGRLAWIDADSFAAARIDPRLMECIFEGHAVIDDERRNLHHRRHDLASARCADRKPAMLAAARDDRTHIRERAFARCEKVRRI